MLTGDSVLITLYDPNGDEFLCLMNDGSEIDGVGHTGIIEPLTIQEAMSTPQAIEWERALNDELASLTANNTWEVVDCPPGKTPIPCKWVLKLKRNELGDVTRYKARLVAKGFKQIPGVVFAEIASPVVRLPTVRTLLALVAAKGWKLRHLDTDTAFLHGKLKENIYMECPEGVDLRGKVLKLNKCLYGLKQAPLVWHETLKTKFEKEGFSISFSDPSMLILVHSKTKAYAAIYVDDQILTGPDESLNNHIKSLILAEFPGKDLGEAQFFVGIRIQRNFELKTLKLSQARHIEALLIAFGQKNANPVKTLMDFSLDLTSDGSSLYQYPQNYMSLVGSLNYIAMCTRPDIAFATGFLCRYMSKPTQNHYNTAIRVLRYLKGTIDFGLVYGNTVSGHDGLKMFAYSDANFAEKEDSISTYGYTFIINGAAVNWSSRKQETVAKSTAEAEFVAASKTTDEALWMNKLMFDLSLSKPISVHMDNTAAIFQVKELPMRNKYIRIHHSAVFERIRNHEVVFTRISTTDMVADILTKPLAFPEFSKFRAALGVME